MGFEPIAFLMLNYIPQSLQLLLQLLLLLSLLLLLLISGHELINTKSSLEFDQWVSQSLSLGSS